MLKKNFVHCKVEVIQKKNYLLLQYCSDESRNRWELVGQLRPFVISFRVLTQTTPVIILEMLLVIIKKTANKVEKRKGGRGHCLLISLPLFCLRGLCNCISLGSSIQRTFRLSFTSGCIHSLSSASFNSPSSLIQHIFTQF